MLTRPLDLEAVLNDVRAAVGDGRRARVPFWRRRRFLALGLIPVALGIGTGAWALTQLRGEDVSQSIGCHNEASLRSSVTSVLAADGRDPVAACAEAMWPGGNAPPLIACANRRHSVVNVFPSEDAGICGELGLEPLPADYRSAARRTRLLLMELQSRLNRRDCYTEAEAESIARTVLVRHGFGDWSFETQDFGPGKRCATGEMVWLGPDEAGVTALPERKVSPLEAALESTGCRGLAEASGRLEHRLARMPGILIKRVVAAPGTPDGLPCAHYGILDWSDRERALVIGALGPPEQSP